MGPEIVDDQGRPVWFLPITNGQIAADFRVQRYHQQPVLTWAQQAGFGGLAQGVSVDYIYDQSYNQVATVTAGNGLDADAPEFAEVRARLAATPAGDSADHLLQQHRLVGAQR